LVIPVEEASFDFPVVLPRRPSVGSVSDARVVLPVESDTVDLPPGRPPLEDEGSFDTSVIVDLPPRPSRSSSLEAECVDSDIDSPDIVDLPPRPPLESVSFDTTVVLPAVDDESESDGEPPEALTALRERRPCDTARNDASDSPIQVCSLLRVDGAMMRSRFVAARFRLAEDCQNMWQMHLRFENGRCETISLFGGRVQAVRATANLDDTQPSFAEHSIYFSASAAKPSRAFACPTADGQARLLDAFCAAGCIMPDMVAQVRMLPGPAPADLPWFVRLAEPTDGARTRTRDGVVALKVAAGAEKKKQLLNEMKFLLTIDHDAILRTYGMYDVKVNGMQSLGFLCDFKDGGDLSSWIPKDGMREELAKGVFAQVCSALKYLYDRRIVHRDIKPSNVFCDQKVDGSFKATLADFGLATRADDAENMSIASVPLATSRRKSSEKIGLHGVRNVAWSPGLNTRIGSLKCSRPTCFQRVCFST
jgi:hypothetical protein